MLQISIIFMYIEQCFWRRSGMLFAQFSEFVLCVLLWRAAVESCYRVSCLA